MVEMSWVKKFMVEKTGVQKSRDETPFNPLETWHFNWGSGVEKFMVEKSGVETYGVEAWGWKVRGLDVLQPSYQYGNDLNSESALSVYRTLMGELLYDDDEQSFGDGNNGQNGRENLNSYDDHNQLGVLRESSSNQGNSNGQSSYARVSLIDFFLCLVILILLRES